MVSILLSLALLFSSTPGVEGPSDEEGFIEVVPEKGNPVKKLHDETGAGEKPPTFRLELSGGLLNVDFLPAGPGGLVSAGAFWRPAGDWWLGARLLGGAAPQRHDAGTLIRGALSLEGRRYFMLHTEANRFIMGHVLGGVGGEVLKMKDYTLTGPSFSAGAGVGVALSPTLYLGVQYVLTFPLWTGNDTDPKAYASYSTFLFLVTVGF
ncbi:MAG: hypothetical protein CVU65_12485 [Deltaproteobacteria bacterium HGW-Deltaproteobacteria-22]|jgi:hypothetical protein|nr:MAG: hypothetical protein CVU65_12485 [Deltaproteobacteria bacterium HGW-Deltaproteobacteria-22]